MDIEDSYVIRIFRRALPGGAARARRNPPSLVGIVENPATGHRQAFHDIEELWAALAKTDTPVSDGKRKTTPTEK